MKQNAISTEEKYWSKGSKGKPHSHSESAHVLPSNRQVQNQSEDYPCVKTTRILKNNTLDTRNPGRPGLQSVPASDSISRRRTVPTLWVSVDLADGTVGKPLMSLVTGCNLMVIGHRVGVDHCHMVCGTPRPPCWTTATGIGDALNLGWDRPMRFPMAHHPINSHHVPRARWWLGR